VRVIFICIIIISINRNMGYSVFFVLLSLVCVSLAAVSPWSVVNQANASPVTKYGMHGQVIYGNDVYIFGGVPENRSIASNFSGNWWEGFWGANGILRKFNTQTHLWSVVTPCNSKAPSARGYFQMVLRGDRIFLFGGQGHNPTLEDPKDLGDMWRFDISSRCWTELTATAVGPKPSPRNSAAMVTMSNGLIYIYGGVQQWGLFLGDLFSYDPATNKFHSLSSSTLTPPPRAISHITTVSNTGFYVWGGCCGSNSETGGYFQDMWFYNIVTNQWSEINQVGVVKARAYSASISIDNGASWLFQGGDLGGCLVDLPLAETAIFNFASRTWFSGILPTYVSGPVIKNARISAISANTLIMFGGYSTSRFDDAWCTQDNQVYKDLVYQYDVYNSWYQAL
jgi:N-acetylneuraminic acid mutarotase